MQSCLAIAYMFKDIGYCEDLSFFLPYHNLINFHYHL